MSTFRTRAVRLLAVFALFALSACGGSDGGDGGGDGSGSAAGGAESSGSAASASVTPAEAEACLDATDYPVDVSDLLGADAMDALGIDSVLGWSFAETGFLGSITFYENESTAEEQYAIAAEFAEAAEASGLNVAERFGVAVVDMTGGTDEALAAARSCLTP